MRKISIIVLAVLCFFSPAILSVHASTTDGAITPGSQTARLCTNDTCTTYTRINFLTTKGTPVSVTSTGLSGDIWSEDWGWINLDPASPSPSGPDCAYTGVMMTSPSSGTLAGCAWGENTGWINFAPTKGGVTIDTSTGNFLGWAWTQNTGWIHFDCMLADACVNTDWRPASGTTGTTTGGTTGGSGGHGTTTGGSTTATTGTAGIGTTTAGTGASGTTATTAGTTGAGTTTSSTGTTAGAMTGGTVGTTTIAATTGTSGTAAGSGSSGSTGVTIGPDTTTGNATTGSVATSGSGGDIISIIRNSVYTPVRKKIVNSVAAAGFVAATFATIVASLFINPFSSSEIILIPFRLWSLFLSALGLRRRPWGTAYDSVTKQPLDPVYVVLQDIQGNEIATSITDMDGRYGFFVKAGEYKMVAHKTNYLFPSAKLAGKKEDEVYKDLYFAEVLRIEKDGDVIAKNIPLDPENFDWNQFAKRQQKLMTFYNRRNNLFKQIAGAFFSVGFILAVLALISAPETYNIAIVSLYAILFVLRETGLRPKPVGSISEKSTGYPSAFAIIRVLSASTKTEIIHRVADQAGRYYCLLQNGTYMINIERKNPDGTYSLAYSSSSVEVTKGYINTAFEI